MTLHCHFVVGMYFTNAAESRKVVHVEKLGQRGFQTGGESGQRCKHPDTSESCELESAHVPVPCVMRAV